MHIHTTCQSLRQALAHERSRTQQITKRIAFVPTMGNLHEGHIALVKQAQACSDCVVASIFVNRLQFGPKEDFDRYPRTLEEDCEKLRAAGVRHVFAPSEAVLFPQPQTYYVEPTADQQNILDGEYRPGHFRGVATIVLKLFNIVQPNVALFGKKDYQQLMIIRNMVREFALPIEIAACETIRAEDGLALSSRNGYLTPTERQEAPHLYACLDKIRHAIQTEQKMGQQMRQRTASEVRFNFAELENQAMAALNNRGWSVQYIAVRKQSDLQLPTCSQGRSDLLILAAAYLGTTRLIDNVEV